MVEIVVLSFAVSVVIAGLIAWALFEDDPNAATPQQPEGPLRDVVPGQTSASPPPGPWQRFEMERRGSYATGSHPSHRVLCDGVAVGVFWPYGRAPEKYKSVVKASSEDAEIQQQLDYWMHDHLRKEDERREAEHRKWLAEKHVADEARRKEARRAVFGDGA